MPLSKGARLGPYEVVAAIGAGGMGEVYRARDIKLGRDVALKVLPPEVASDPERIARFEREARTLASLNHPHIAHVHGFEDSTGVAALVMELVEGPTLADRIERGPIPITEVLPIARQIAEAFEAAHEQGIVHRDLKPANIKVADDGNVKVLDFGLAKVVDGEFGIGGSESQNRSDSPTVTTPAVTMHGVILGTAAYMSPEQARAKPVDKRTDIWAFGCVLFEMLTARRAFEGDDVADTIAAILRGTPDLSALPVSTPPAIRRLLRRCLEKDVRSRLSDMAMVRVELDDAESEPDVLVAAAIPPKRRLVRTVTPYAAAIVAALLTGVVVWRVRHPTERAAAITRFSIETMVPADTTFTRNPAAISPDGTRLVFALNQRLYLRDIDQLEAIPIPGTEPTGPTLAARSPVFSPDGQFVAYWQDGQFRKVALRGGSPVTLCEMGSPVGASWEADGRILLGRLGAGIQSVPDTGGTLTTLASVEDGESAYAPQILPGGQWLLFTLRPKDVNSQERSVVVIQSLATAERRIVLEGVREARYLPSGHLVFGRGNALLAQPFDLRRLTVSGGPVPVLEGVSNSANTSPAMHFAVSPTGTLFFLPGARSVTPLTRLVHVTRNGIRTVLAEVDGMSWFPRYSPDGTRVAYGMSVGVDNNDRADLWTVDVARSARTRITFSRADEQNYRYYPIWTRDGTRLAHADGSDATNRLIATAADGSGASETLLDAGGRWFPSSWSPDGRALAIYGYDKPAGGRNLAIVQKTGDRWSSMPFVATPFEESGAIFSPSGRWLAYVSNKTGRSDVFARPYPGPGPEVTISAGGGREPVWAPSGKELFYRNSGKLYSVRIDERASSLGVGAPTSLFDDPYRPDTGASNGGMANYDIAPDGNRFVMVEVPKATGPPARLKLHVVVNWLEELKQRVPITNASSVNGSRSP